MRNRAKLRRRHGLCKLAGGHVEEFLDNLITDDSAARVQRLGDEARSIRSSSALKVMFRTYSVYTTLAFRRAVLRLVGYSVLKLDSLVKTEELTSSGTEEPIN